MRTGDYKAIHQNFKVKLEFPMDNGNAGFQCG